MNNVTQLHESYENCTMYLLTTIINGELDVTQFHSMKELQEYVDTHKLMYYTIEKLF